MATKVPREIVYPSSDGKPMAENTLQFEWIVTIKEGMEVVFRDDPMVFVAGDLLWYPVEGQTTITQAADTMVVFGRPKGHRPSYLQWKEDNIAPQLAFEVLSHTNTAKEMQRKLEFYDKYQVNEYYEYNPYKVSLKGWRRVRKSLRRIRDIEEGWTSPLLNVRFELADELILYGPDGSRFLTFLELDAAKRQAEAAKREAEALAKKEKTRADQQQQRADQQQQRADQQQQRADQQQQRAERYLTMLHQLGLHVNGPPPS